MKTRNRTAVAGILAMLLVLSACGSGDDGSTSADDPSRVADTQGDDDTTDGTGDTNDGPAATEAPDDQPDDQAAEAPEDSTPLEATGLATSTPAGTTEIDSITWAVYRPTAPIDPLFVLDYPEQVPLALMCETPLQTTSEGTIGPGLATVERPDDTTYVLTLREGATFWNGDPVTAEDVAFALNRRAETPGPFWLYFDRVASIEVTDGTTVTITMSEPDAFFESLLSGTGSYIYQKSFFEAAGEDFGNSIGGIMCSGSYELGDWSAGSSLTVVRNDDYWQPVVKPLVRSIDFVGIEDPFAVSAGLQSGDIDGYFAFASIPTLVELEADENVTVTHGAGYQWDALLLDPQEASPLNDARVRRALSLAIDRRGYIDSVLVGAGDVPRSVVSPGTWGYSRDVFEAGYKALPDPVVDIETAQALVAEAGVEGQSISIGYIAEVPPMAAEGALVQAAAESIGLEVELVAFPADQYIGLFDPADDTLRSSVDGWFTVAYPDAADPGLALAQVTTPTGNLNYGYSNDEVTDLLDKARSTFDDDARAALIVQAQSITVEDPPLIVVAHPNNVLLTSSDLTGAWPSFAHMFGPWANELGGA
jgi:peptide/nickel transport system substrate-binding protein